MNGLRRLFERKKKKERDMMTKNIKILKLCPKCGQPMKMQRKIWGEWVDTPCVCGCGKEGVDEAGDRGHPAVEQ